jgi:TRAP-type C4-dicarboxylate transport system substrate-binding protein
MTHAPALRSPLAALRRRARELGALAVLLALLAWCAAPAHAQGASKVRLGTLAPKGSSLYKSLQTMGEEWRRASDGQLSLQIYADGSMGGEADMVRRMRQGQINAGLLTAVGLADIEPEVSGLQSMPLMFRTLEEVDRVGALLQPRLSASLESKGFVVLFWIDVGWVRFFSKSAVRTPDELRKLKLFTWSGSPEQVEIFKATGFRPVPLETGDIVPAMQSGLIEAVVVPPIYALATQIDRSAPHMLELNWAPLVGACVMTKKSWDAIPENVRERVLAAARTAGDAIRASSRRESDQAVEAMQKRGLTVHKLTPEALMSWQELERMTRKDVRGRIVPTATYDEVARTLEEFRAGAAANDGKEPKSAGETKSGGAAQ